MTVERDFASSQAMYERNRYLLRVKITEARRRRLESRSIIGMIKRVWPWFIVEECHLLMAGFLEAFRDGMMPLSMVWVAPRAAKSLMTSVITPANYLGLYPKRHIMIASHTESLAEEFSRTTRDMIGMEEYRQIFPGAAVRRDVAGVKRWRTWAGGGMAAAGVGTGIAGKGYHRGLIDDPLNEKTATSDTEVMKVNNWYGPGFWTRRDPTDSAINITQTRWLKNDLSGFLIARAKEDKNADQPQVLRIPALIDEPTAELLNEMAGHPLLSPRSDGSSERYHFKPGDSFAPRRFPLSMLLKAQANNPQFEALYQQNPTNAEGNIYKRRCWRKWDGPPPPCFLIVQIYDTAFDEEDIKTNSYCARTTWGVFEWDGDGVPRNYCVLLEAWRGRPGFNELMVLAETSYREFDADQLIIEKKASGYAMLSECRRRGIRCQAFDPKTKSKTARASAGAVVLESGNVFYMPRPFAKAVIDECADFPTGEYNDWVDTCTMNFLWMRLKHLQTHEEADTERERQALESHFGGEQPAQLA